MLFIQAPEYVAPTPLRRECPRRPRWPRRRCAWRPSCGTSSRTWWSTSSGRFRRRWPPSSRGCAGRRYASPVSGLRTRASVHLRRAAAPADAARSARVARREPWFARKARRDPRELNDARQEIGLAPHRRLYGGISEGLGMVATYPQFEYPRRWPTHVHVTGPMLFEPPQPEVELPDGEGPLVLVAGSSGQDQELRFVHAGHRALPTSRSGCWLMLARRGRRWKSAVPANAVRSARAPVHRFSAGPRWSSPTGGTGRWPGRSAKGPPWSSAPPEATWGRTSSEPRGPAQA